MDWVWASSRSWWWIGKPGVHGVTNSRTWLSNWTELNWMISSPDKCLINISQHCCQEDDDGASLIAQVVKNLPAMQETRLDPGVRKIAGEGIGYPLQYSWASLVAQLVKNPPTMQETWVWPLGWEDPLKKGKATHSSILAWRIPWTV